LTEGGDRGGPEIKIRALRLKRTEGERGFRRELGAVVRVCAGVGRTPALGFGSQTVKRLCPNATQED